MPPDSQFHMSTSKVHIPSIETAIYLLERAKESNDMQLLLSALDAIVIALPELEETEQTLIKEKLLHYYELTQPADETHWLTKVMTSIAIMVKQSPIPMLLTSTFEAFKDILIRLDTMYNIQENGIVFVRLIVKQIIQLIWRMETDYKLSEKMSHVAKSGAVLVGKTVVAYQNADNFQVRQRKSKRRISL